MQREPAGENWDVKTVKSGRTSWRSRPRRSRRRLTKAGGLGESWTPRELRHTFVSIASEAGVPIEEIAALAGHSTTRTTELVYRKELGPVLRTGATVMGELLAAGQ